jgi:hypothetical protein
MVDLKETIDWIIRHMGDFLQSISSQLRPVQNSVRILFNFRFTERSQLSEVHLNSAAREWEFPVYRLPPNYCSGILWINTRMFLTLSQYLEKSLECFWSKFLPTGVQSQGLRIVWPPSYIPCSGQLSRTIYSIHWHLINKSLLICIQHSRMCGECDSSWKSLKSPGRAAARMSWCCAPNT